MINLCPTQEDEKSYITYVSKKKKSSFLTYYTLCLKINLTKFPEGKGETK